MFRHHHGTLLVGEGCGMPVQGDGIAAVPWKPRIEHIIREGLERGHDAFIRV